MGDTRLSNVIGAPFAEHVLTQLDLRAVHNSTKQRSEEEVLFLANKTAWAKLTSSVRVIPTENETLRQFYEKLGLGTNYASKEALAKNWILEAGTSVGNGAAINLRRGIGIEGAYGMGGTEELGYRPMPGLTSVTVDSKGTLGSLREAIISFKVWNMNQLNVIEALYFRLGFSMVLEWGHTQFYSNVNQAGGPRGGTFTTNTYGIDPFQNYRKEVLQQTIVGRGKELSGNYDAMLGIVTNFTWAFNQDGGYDCTVKLIGLGAIIDSLRINLSYKMPDIIFQEYQTQQKLLENKLKQEEARKAQIQEEQRREAEGLPSVLPALPSNASEIYTNIYTADLGTPTPGRSQQDFLSNINVPVSNPAAPNVSTLPDYFYKAEKGGAKSQPLFIKELNTTRTGLFLNPLLEVRNKWQVLFTESPSSITVSRKFLNSFSAATVQTNEIDLGGTLGEDNFVKLFDTVLQDQALPSTSTGTAIVNLYGITPDDKIFPGQKLQGDTALKRVASFFGALALGTNTIYYDQFINLITSYTSTVKLPNGQNITREFQVSLSYRPIVPLQGTDNGLDPNTEKNRPTRRELMKALQDWFNGGRKINVTEVRNIAPIGQVPQIKITGTLADISIPGRNVPEFIIQFTNTGLVETVLPPAPPTPAQQPQQIQSGNTGNTEGTENTTSTEQVDQAQRFASALHAMLSAVKSQVQTKSISVSANDVVYTDSLLELTDVLYRDGVFDGILKYTLPIQVTSREAGFNLKNYALKGFNSNLMADKDLYGQIPKVDFEKLCTAYAIRYTVKGEESAVNFPVYIKFGYLLSFLNSMCLIYDSTQDTEKHPYVYLDFNPDTNFCLSSPEHLSIDPFVCMIPFEGNGLSEYLKLYPNELQQSVQDKAETLFSPSTNAVSGFLNSFKTPENAYQGKTMEILLNVDFLLNTLNQYTTNDEKHSINLKGFLDATVTGVNKSLGNYNLFRVSYRDDSNTVIIKDDQFVPPYPGEDYMLDRAKYLANGPRNVPKYGQLPVFGLQSLVREMEFKTDLTTNLANVIAISAQAQTGSANSTDYTPFSYLNVNYEDAYKTVITDSTDSVKVPTANVTGSVANDLNQALQFNTHLLNIYYDGRLSRPRVDFATNYYIERMSKIKSSDQVTIAAPPIPANLSLTIDGISGIVMGNAFTIPESRLPVSLRGSGDQTKVGFVVVGLTHVIDKNQWLTKIRGQMIKLRDTVKYAAPGKLEKIQPAFSLGEEIATADLGTVNLNQDWIGIAYDFIARKEGFLSQAKYDVNAYRVGYGSDIVVAADNKILRVTSTTTVTRADAERTLKYSIANKYKNAVVSQIGEAAWERLNSRQKAALVSYAYNAGGGALKTWNIAKAIATNASPQQVAKLIEIGPVTAKGVRLDGLVARRKEEALLYLS